MKEIKIRIDMNSEQDIIISNGENSKNITLSGEKIVLSAKELYDLFDYSIGNKYDIQTNIDENISDNKKKIFNDIADTVNRIAKEINDIDFSDDEEE